jgi:hypothetical protein
VIKEGPLPRIVTGGLACGFVVRISVSCAIGRRCLDVVVVGLCRRSVIFIDDPFAGTTVPSPRFHLMRESIIPSGPTFYPPLFDS